MGSAHVNRMCGYVGDVLAMSAFDMLTLHILQHRECCLHESVYGVLPTH